MHNCHIYEEAASCRSSKKTWTVIHHDPSPLPMPTWFHQPARRLSKRWSWPCTGILTDQLMCQWARPGFSICPAILAVWLSFSILLRFFFWGYIGYISHLNPFEPKNQPAPDADAMHLTTDCCHWCCFSARQLTCHWWRSGPRYSPPTSRWDDDKPGFQLCLEKIPNREKYLRSIDGCLCC